MAGFMDKVKEEAKELKEKAEDLKDKVVDKLDKDDDGKVLDDVKEKVTGLFKKDKDKDDDKGDTPAPPTA